MANATCSDPECDKSPLARGMCVTHYHRWNRATKGDRPPPGVCRGCGTEVPPATGPPRHYCGPECRPRCSVDGCEKPRHGHVYCSTHHTRWKRYGDPVAPRKRMANGPRKPRGRVVPDPCSVDGCDRPSRKRGWCVSHYSQWRRGEEPHEFNHRWGEGGYVPTHRMLRRERGPAADYQCVDCEEPAREWSYNGDDPDEITDGDGRTFTRNMTAYSPRCFRCHRIFDKNPIAVRSP